MRRCLMLVAVVVAAASAAPAYGAAPDGALGPWADSVVDFNQAMTVHPVGPVPLDRSDPTAALGVAESPPGDNNPIPAGTFVSLGFGGSLTLGFDNPICNGTGVDLDIDVLEITLEPYPPETADVYVSEDGVTFLFAGTVIKDGSVAMPAGIVVANFVRLVDVSNPALFMGRPTPPDGFDVDGVMARNTSCPTGKIEVCKSTANGMAGRTFQFSLNGGSPFSVRGGRCTGPITTRPGLNTIEELPTIPPTDIQSVAVRPSIRLVSLDLEARTVQVRVLSGSTAANETKVTFTNEPGGGADGDLKICKTTTTPVLLGAMFSFRVNGGPLISTEAGPEAVPAEWSCRPAGTFQTGTVVTVQEVVPQNTVLASIRTDPASRLQSQNLATGTATLLIGGGQNIIIFRNEAAALEQTGFIQICKDAARTGPGSTPDPEVTGLFTFTVDPPSGPTFNTSTYVGQCTGPLQVAAGIVRVTEQARPGFRLVDVWTNPDTALLFDNVINGWADVEVPVSATSNFESQVHFVNAVDRADFKVCKALAAGSDALAGRPFTFTVRDLDAVTPVTQEVSVTAPAVGTPGCKSVGTFPVGHRIEVLEPNPGPFVTASGGGIFVVQPGVATTVTITNTAMGELQICKNAVAGLSAGAQPFFRFRIDGGGYISVRAGGACATRPVTAGQHTVVEQGLGMASDFVVSAITVSPPDRVVGAPDPATGTVTVTVPHGPAGPTVVTYTNQVKTGTVQVCKEGVSTPNIAFSFTVYVEGPPNVFTATAFTLMPGQCHPGLGPYPILQSDGTPTIIGVQETVGPGFTIASITATGTRGPCTPANGPPECPYASGQNTTTGIIDFYLGPGLNRVGYTNSQT